MRYAKLSCIEFYSCYLQQCHSIDFFSYRTPDRGQKGHMNKLYPSFYSEVFMELALQVFSGTEHGVRGPCGVVFGRKKMFYTQNGENSPSPGFFECIGKFRVLFFIVLYFFISVLYNESLYYCNSFMLEHILCLEKFCFLR